jgi:hypothetical protein
VIVPATARYATACPPIVTDPSVVESGDPIVDAAPGFASLPLSLGFSCAMATQEIVQAAATNKVSLAARLHVRKSMFTSSSSECIRV